VATVAIVLAGGSGARVDPAVNKVYLNLGDRTILGHSLETMQTSTVVDRIILVVRPVDRPRATEIVAQAHLSKLIAIVDGGATRQASEMAGLQAIAGEIESGGVDLVAIHDGARPFASLSLIEAVVAAARVSGGAIPALPVDERLYRAADDTAEPLSAATLVRVQTPQAFAARPLLAAYRSAATAGFAGFDTAETMEKFSNVAVRCVAGDPRNIKLTFVEDFFLAEELAARWQAGRWK